MLTQCSLKEENSLETFSGIIEEIDVNKSVFTLVRRSIAAARLGFAFYGTTRTTFPKTVRLKGGRIPLSVPQDSGYLYDLINVWLDDEYGLRSVACPPRCILDCGANVGIFSLWAVHNFPGAKVHAYEPNPRVQPYLQSNLRGTSVNLFFTGLGADHGRAGVRDVGESRIASTFRKADGEVTIEPLAEAILRLGGSVDLLKLDCEGAEWEMFKDKKSFERVKEIRMEYHLAGGHSLDEFKHKAEDLGFSIWKLSPNQGFGIAWLRRNSS